MPFTRRWLRKRDREVKGRTETAASKNSRWEVYRQLLEVSGVWVEAVGVLAAAVVGIQQYKENSRAEQVNKTLKYLDRFQEDRVFNARRTLEQAWNAKRNEVFDIQSHKGEAQLAKYLEKEIQKQNLEPLIATVMDFYDELHACTTAELCDRDTAVRFFGKYAWDFHGLLAPHIKAQREELHDDFVGFGIRYFSREYRSFLEQRRHELPPKPVIQKGGETNPAQPPG